MDHLVLMAEGPDEVRQSELEMGYIHMSLSIWWPKSNMDAEKT